MDNTFHKDIDINKKQKKHFALSFLILGIILAVYTISLLIPLLWTILTSLRSRNDFIRFGALAWPEKLYFNNFINAFQIFRIKPPGELRWVYLDQMFFNSVIYSIGMAFMSTLAPCITAYLTAKYRYKFSKFVYGLVIVLMLIPIVGNMPSMIVVLRSLHLYNTYFGMICMKFNFANTYFIILYSAFKSIPNDYMEVARIDGASETNIMFNIMFPLVKTTIGAVFLLLLIAMWNDHMTLLMYYPSRPTAALGLMLYSQNNLVNSVPEQLAGAIIVIMPILIVYLIFKKYLMGNLTMGGLKG